MYSKEDHDRDWELVRQLICEVYDIPPSFTKGVDHMRQLWMQKSWAFPFLDSNGRLIKEVEYTVDKKHLLEYYPKFVALGRVLAAKEGYADVFQYDRGMSAIRSLLRLMENKFSVKDILNNKLSQDLYVGETKVAKGTKLTKALRVLVLKDEYEWACGRFIGYSSEKKKEVADFMILFYSQIISMISNDSRDCVVISFNPLDILMSSWVTTNWRSCHHLVDGQYRFGPYSFLLDGRSGIVYAYRELSKATHEKRDFLKGYKFPKKLWRQMVFFDIVNSSAVFSREYPQTMSSFASTARTMGAELLNRVKGTDFKEWRLVKHADISVMPNEKVISSSVDIQHGSWHYPDNPTATIVLGKRFVGKIGVDEVPCPCCGEKYSSAKNLPEGFCPNCHEILIKCGICGKRFISIGKQEYNVCPSCIETYAVKCAHCKKTVLSHGSHSVKFGDQFYCRKCAEDLLVRCYRCGEINRKEDLVHVREIDRHFYYCTECAQERVVVCAHCKTNVRISRAYELGGEWFCVSCVTTVERGESIEGEG